jgi:hypothetical protein
MTNTELDPEDKQERIERLMECTKEEIATQWVTLGSDMKQKYDKLKIEFIEYKMANDISRFFEDIRSEKSNEILGSKIRGAIEGNILYIDWLKKQESKAKLARKKFYEKS